MHNLPSLRRLKEIVAVLFDYELHHFIKVLGLKSHLPIHKRFEPLDTHFVTQPETVREIFEKLGGAFIKLGQLLALRPDLIGSEYSKEFEKLLLDVPPEDPIVIKGLVREIPFTKFYEKPLGSASIAQVHKAVLNGKTVAVKIKRPDAERKFEEDIKIMGFLARKIKERYNPSYVDPVNVVQEFKRYTEKELDFRHEAANMKRFAKNFKGSRDIVIPKVYEKYSNKDILIMEFVDGKSIFQVKSSKRAVINKVTSAVQKMIFEDRFFHADLHPGNIYIKGNKLIFLDFGIVGHIDRALDRKLFYLYSSLVEPNIDHVADALLDLNNGSEEPDAQYLKDGLYDVLGDYYDQPLDKMDFGKVFFGTIEVARKSNIRIPAQLVLFGKSLVTMQGFCREIDPKFNVVKHARPYVKKFIRKKMSAQSIMKQTKDAAMQAHEFVVGLPENIRKLSRKFTIIEERVVDIDATVKLLTRVIWKSAKLLTLTILFCAFFISGLLLMNYPLFYKGFSLLSLVGFGVSAVLFIGILRLLMREP